MTQLIWTQVSVTTQVKEQTGACCCVLLVGRLFNCPEWPPSIQKTSSLPFGVFCMFIKCSETTVSEPLRNAHQKSLALQHGLQPVLGEYHRAVGKGVLQGLPDHLGSPARQTNTGIQTAVCMPITALTCATAWLGLVELPCRDSSGVPQLHLCCQSTYQP